jgi:GT2 family glycosyltransferase
MQNNTPLISVITPVNDDRPNFDRYFDGWFRQSESFNLFEVIIITTNKSQFDAVNKSLEKYSSPNNKDLNIRIFSLEGIGSSRAKAINHGIKTSNGNIVFLFGDDYIPKTNAIREHIAFHNENREIFSVGIGMAFLPNEFRNQFTEWLEVSGSLFGIPFTKEATSIPPDYFYIANTSIKKDFLQKSGLFDEDFKYHSFDDWELGNRLKKLGLHSKLIIAASAIHQHDVTFEERITSIRELGASSRLYKNKNQGLEVPWRKEVNKFYPLLVIKMYLFKLLGKVTKSKKILHKQFKYQIKIAFYEGYHSKINYRIKSHFY